MRTTTNGSGGGQDDRLTAGLISSDPELMDGLRALLSAGTDEVELGLELDCPYDEIDDGRVDSLLDLAPAVLFLDLDRDPETGLAFARYLQNQSFPAMLVGIASELSQDLLKDAMRAGLSEVLERPLDSLEVQEAVERARRRQRPTAADEPGGDEDGELFLVLGTRSGSGATTVATNLAVTLRRLTGENTLLVDLDLDLGDAATFLGLRPNYTVTDLLQNLHRADSRLLAGYVASHESGIDLLASPETPDWSDEVSAEEVGEMLRLLKRRYRYLVVDAPRSSGNRMRAAAAEADRVLLVAAPDIPSVRNVGRLRAVLQEDGRTGTDDRIQVVVNRHRSRGALGLSEIEKALDTKVLAALNNDYDTVSDAINLGRPAVDDDSSKFTRDVRWLAETLLPGSGEPTSERRGWRGALSRLVTGEG